MTLTTQESPALPPTVGNEAEPETRGSGRQVVQLLVGAVVRVAAAGR